MILAAYFGSSFQVMLVLAASFPVIFVFGAHGGLLDRLDAVFFTIVVGYYLSVQLVY